MDKKAMMFCGNTITAAAVLIGLIVVGTSYNAGVKPALGAETDYSITFGVSTNKIGAEPYVPSIVHSGNGFAATGLGNQFGFEYNSFYNPTDVWQTIKGGGYFTNTDPIRGMKSIELAKTDPSASFTAKIV